MGSLEDKNTKQCCAAFYGSDLARLILGDSFHPGGTALTRRLGEMLHLGPDSLVLDVASGRGTSAFYLAETFGCQLIGIDLSEENVRVAIEEATRRRISDRVSFRLGDAERLPVDAHSFDAMICECAFCTFPDKPLAARDFVRVLKPGGYLGLSDITRTDKPIPELDGLLAWIACLGDALPMNRYTELLRTAGFHIDLVEDHSMALIEMVRQIQGKLLGAEIMTGLGKLELPGVDFTRAKQFARAALDAIHFGKLGYAIMVAQKC